MLQQRLYQVSTLQSLALILYLGSKRMNGRYFGELEIVHQCPASLLGQSTQDKLKHEVALLQVFGLLPLFRFSTSMESGVVKVQLDAVRNVFAIPTDLEIPFFSGNAGGLEAFLRNPKFLVTLVDPDLEDENTSSTVVISLAQKVETKKEKLHHR